MGDIKKQMSSFSAITKESRTSRRSEDENGPGPNAYLLPSLTGDLKHDYTKFKSPAYTLKHRNEITPKKSEVRYVNLSETQKPTTPMWTLHSRHTHNSTPETPGPNAYKLPGTLNIKQYTLKGRYPNNKAVIDTPRGAPKFYY